MPGENCGFYGCTNNRTTDLSRRRKDPSISKISFFQIPSPNERDSEETKEKKITARNEWIRIVCRTRVRDSDLDRQFKENKFYLCETHFNPSDIDEFPTRKVLRTGSVPSINLPRKSLDDGEVKEERRSLVRDLSLKGKYTSFSKFIKGVETSKIHPWSYEVTDRQVNFTLADKEFWVPRFYVSIYDEFSVAGFYYGWRLPDINVPEIQQYGVTKFLSSIDSASVCDGLPAGFTGNNTLNHVVPQRPSHDETALPFLCKNFVRSKACTILLQNKCSALCSPCESLIEAEKRNSNVVTEKKIYPAKKKAPLSACSKEKLIMTVRESRLKCSQLETELKRLRKEINESGCNVSDELHSDLSSIFEKAAIEITPHMKLMWEEQQKLCQVTPMARRYHPQFIRFCLSIQAKSSSAYDELSEMLILPSQRCLRNYKHAFAPKPGLTAGNVSRMESAAANLSGAERYVGIALDEMKISSGLVFDKTTGNLIGYTDLGDPMVDFTLFDDCNEFATHALVFLVRGVCSSLKSVLSYYLTGSSGVTSCQLWPIFWEAVFMLEFKLNLWVVFAVCDGASQNRKFFRMHRNMSMENAKITKDPIYFTINIAAPERKIYFLSDVPHLIKTTRNCLLSSGFSANSKRLMLNNGKHLLWSHIAQAYHKDLELGLHRLVKIGPEHINISPFGKMRVSYAVQVLSRTMSLALTHYFPNGEADETAKLCSLINDFFDMCNVRSTTECTRKRNSNLEPFKSVDDPRLAWMKDCFLQYFEKWLQTIEETDEISKEDKSKMFISKQTFEGYKITVNSIIELIRFLLLNGVKYVLTERFMQDVLEEYFGYQRSHGRRCDNPMASEFGYNDQIINMQRTIAPKGNVRGKHSLKWSKVSDEPLPTKQFKK